MRVLIADDDPIILLDLKQMLESQGYEVVGEAEDGQKAVDLARSLNPDVCILDIKMPKMDGIEAVSIITDEEISPCIMITSYNDSELISRAAAAGTFAYLVKPYNPRDLPPAIEVARSRYNQNKDLTKEVRSLSDKLEARKVIERAKGLLMEEKKISESEAYRLIQLQSMNRRTSMKEVAEDIIHATAV